MPPSPLYHLSPAGSRPVPAPLAATVTGCAGLAAVALPAAGESASLWVALAHIAPASAHNLFALSVGLLVGITAWLCAEAFAQRSLRPALVAAIAGALLTPALFTAPVWLPLLAAAALVATPAPRRLRAANDNPAPADRAAHPFSLAA